MQSHADRDLVRRTVATALLLAVAAVLGYLESVLVPPLPIPGLRIGLANVAVVFALATLGPRAAVTVSLGRVFVVALATGSLASPVFALSFGGALAALVVMVALASAGSHFSVIGWSVGGSAAHVAGQLLVATMLVGSGAPLALAPVSLALSLPVGLAVGYITRLLLSRIPDVSLSVAGR